MTATVVRIPRRARPSAVEEAPAPEPGYRRYIRAPMCRFEPTPKRAGELVVTSREIVRIEE